MEVYYSMYSPPSRSVLLTLKALDLQPEMKELDLFKGEHKEAWFLKLNPTHTLPTIDDNGFSLYESRAILGYLVNKYGKDDSLYPSEPQKRARVDRMLYFDIGSFYSSVTGFWNPQIFANEPPDSQKENVLKQCLDYFDGFLTDSKYAAGDQLTIADFSLLASVTALDMYSYDYSGYPNITKWVEALKEELPYYDECIQQGVDKGKEFVEASKQ